MDTALSKETIEKIEEGLDKYLGQGSEDKRSQKLWQNIASHAESIFKDGITNGAYPITQAFSDNMGAGFQKGKEEILMPILTKLLGQPITIELLKERVCAVIHPTGAEDITLDGRVVCQFLSPHLSSEYKQVGDLWEFTITQQYRDCSEEWLRTRQGNEEY